MKKPTKTEETTPETKQPKEKYTHNISNGEFRFLEAQHEAQVKREDYLAAMEQSNFE